MWVSLPARLIVLAVLVVAATGAATIYCATATKRYEAQAELLVATLSGRTRSGAATS